MTELSHQVSEQQEGTMSTRGGHLEVLEMSN